MEERAVSFAEMLRRIRESAGLSQRALAQRAGLSVDAVGMLERGVRSNPRAETVLSLARALRLDALEREELLRAAGRGTGLLPPEATGLTIVEGKPNAASLLSDARALVGAMPTSALPPLDALPAGSRMSLGINPLFVGRGEELTQVATALKGADATVALGQVVASTGLGGLGKTQLAAEFVHRYGRFFAGGVFWLSFASAEDIPLQVAACAGPAFEARSLEERLELVKRAWQSPLPRLLVFDNCEEESLLEAWRPTSGGSRVLVTSRRSRWSPTLGVTALPLDLLPRADSIGLLRHYRPDLAPDDPLLGAIAVRLGDLPLALHLAGCYLRNYCAEVSLEDYLAELERPDLIGHASLLGEGLDDSPSPTHHVQSLAQTFALCLGRLDREREEDRVAIALLARLAWMAPGEAVPRALLGGTLEEVGARRRADGLRRLGAVGLVEEGEGWLRLHRLLVHFVRQEEDLDRAARPAVARALIRRGEDAEEGRLTGSALAAVIPHVVEMAGSAVDSAGDERQALELFAAAGRTLQRAGDLRAARPWYERALTTAERALGPDHPDTASRSTNLGVLLWAQGELAVARPRLERALAIRERFLGRDHPDTAASLNDLGALFTEQGDLPGARALLERALDVRERVLGRDHPDTAQSLNDMGVLLKARGELAAARPLLERALAIRERSQGPDHPNTVINVNNLAQLLRNQGELAAARPLYERTLAAWERVMGPDHPYTARALNNLGTLLRDQGELDAARALHERALAIRERVLGPDNSDTAASIHNLAAVFWDQGELAAARPLYERALDIWERVLGPDHPTTAYSVHGLARVLRAQGELDAARANFERALAIWERVLVPDHPHVVATRHLLAELDG